MRVLVNTHHDSIFSGETNMAQANLGSITHPTHCEVSGSSDCKQIALTFRGDGFAPVSIVLPVLGAAELQQKLFRSLLLLGVRAVPRGPADAGPLTPAAEDASQPQALNS